jgi:hypothetical protein
MLMTADAASEAMIRLDMTNAFLRLMTKLSLRKARRADYAKSIMGDRFDASLPLKWRTSLSDVRQPNRL